MNTAPTPLFTLVFGPTASGKTNWAFQEAKHLQANILSYDSRQVFTGMDIVTGKDIPTSFVQETEPHSTFTTIPVYSDGQTRLYGFDIVTPDEDWSIAHFYRYAAPIIAHHRAEQKPLILVGGSWQYASVLLDPPESLFVPVNQVLRTQLASKKREALQIQLQEADADRWEKMNQSDQANHRRLVRALEIAHAKPTPVEPLLHSEAVRFHFISNDPTTIRSRIAERVQQRFSQGALEETQKTYAPVPKLECAGFFGNWLHLLTPISSK
ncbi:hypothetical protein LRY60_05170 [Candidatus Woesebacteria bacterium]|nr:hypothetical protein [Candidatus Woesebacteria bacterium]